MLRRSRSPLRHSPESDRAHSDPPRTRRAVDYNDVRFEFMSGKLINSKLLHAIDEQQLYRYRITHKTLAQYNCYVTVCSAKLYLDVTTQHCFRKEKQPQVHNHGPNDNIELMQLNATIKKRCRSATSAVRSGGGSGNIRQIFHNTLRE